MWQLGGQRKRLRRRAQISTGRQNPRPGVSTTAVSRAYVCGIRGNEADALKGRIQPVHRTPRERHRANAHASRCQSHRSQSTRGGSERTGQKLSRPTHHSLVYNHPGGGRMCAVQSPNDNDDAKVMRSQQHALWTVRSQENPVK